MNTSTCPTRNIKAVFAITATMVLNGDKEKYACEAKLNT